MVITSTFQNVFAETASGEMQNLKLTAIGTGRTEWRRIRQRCQSFINWKVWSKWFHNMQLSINDFRCTVTAAKWSENQLRE